MPKSQKYSSHVNSSAFINFKPAEVKEKVKTFQQINSHFYAALGWCIFALLYERKLQI